MRSEQWTLTEGMCKEKGLPVPQSCWTSCTDTADSCISTGAFLTLQPSNRCTFCCRGFAFRAGLGGKLAGMPNFVCVTYICSIYCYMFRRSYAIIREFTPKYLIPNGSDITPFYKYNIS